MDELGPPRDLNADALGETDALDAVGQADALERWAQLPREDQRLWLAMLVARTRALRERPLGADLRDRTRDIISRYPPWAKQHQPGHVNGMRAEHRPIGGTWAEDARRYWDALSRALVLDDVSARTEQGPPKKKRPTGGGEAEPDVVIDPDWPHWPAVRDRRALVAGGDPRDASRRRLEQVFGLRSLEWPELDAPRKLAAVAQRIRHRTIELVIVLQPFVSHNESNTLIVAAKDADTPWLLTEGYGVTSVKRAVERFLGST
jgi:hypothetical protein